MHFLSFIIFLGCVLQFTHLNAEQSQAEKSDPTLASAQESQKNTSESHSIFNPKFLLAVLEDKKTTESKPSDAYATTPLFITRQNDLPQWLVEASLKSAPLLAKGIIAYLFSTRCQGATPSFHRFILVGAPGTGKTTLAKAIAKALGYPFIFIPSSSILGAYRNEAAIKIEHFFREICADGMKKIVVIDELHKLFENYDSEFTDSSQTASAFWLALDNIEKNHPYIIVIGTANSVKSLPPELKSRFHGKIITMPLPSKKQRLLTVRSILAYDKSFTFDASVDGDYFKTLIIRLNEWSLRDIQLLFDTAKMFAYAIKPRVAGKDIIIVTRSHLEKAFRKLNKETDELKESWLEKLQPDLKNWGRLLTVTASIGTLLHTIDWLHYRIKNIAGLI